MQEKLNNEVEAPNDLAAEEAGWKLQAPLEMLLPWWQLWTVKVCYI